MKRHLISLSFALSLIQTAVSVPAFSPAFRTLSRQAPLADPWDFSWVQKWAAIGDSYAAGIGAGKSLGAGSCSRYDESYPNYINGEDGFGRASGEGFDFLACSGDTSTKVLDTQVSQMRDGDYDVITVSAGGNDVGFFDIVNQCVFTFYRIPVVHSCSKSLDAAKGKIEQDLPGNIDKLLSTLKLKLKPGGKIYYTGYAKFFSTDDRQCDNVSWFVWKGLSLATDVLWREFLTLERRQQMNDLTDQVNSALKAAVQRAGSDVVFIDYDQYFQDFQGRFCEASAPETAPNRDDLLFYEWNTLNPGEDSGLTRRAGEPVPEGSFEGDIAEAVLNTTNEHPEVQFAPENTEPMTPEPGPGGGPERGLFVDWLIPDTVKRIFHPRPVSYQIIGNLVLWHIATNRGKALGYSMTGENVDLGQGSCPTRGRLTCGGKSADSVPARYILNEAPDPHQQQVTPNELLYRLRQVLCTGACEAPEGVKESITISYPQKGSVEECEVTVALDKDTEVWAYRGTAPRDSQWQQCWDATMDVIEQCVKNEPNTGWVNGPHEYQFYQMGFRPKNGDGAKHAPFQVSDFLSSGSPICSSDCGSGGDKGGKCQGGPFDGVKCCGSEDGSCSSNNCDGANGICWNQWKGCPCSGGKSAPIGTPSDCQKDCCSTILDLGWCELNCKDFFGTPQGICV